MKINKFGYVAALTTVLLASACGRPAYADGDDDWQSDRDTRVCRDKRGLRVDEKYCKKGYTGGGNSAFMWYYLGRGSYIPPVGSSLSRTNGSYRGVAGRSYYSAPRAAPMGAVTRGGFGSFGGSHSGSIGG